MFWKKKPTAVAETTTAQPGSSAAAAPQRKTKPLSKKDALALEIEHLEPDRTLTYRLPDFYNDPFIMVELNTAYPQKGRKYNVCQDKLSEGKPAGRKTKVWDSNKPREIAGWILEREGKPYAPAS